MPTCTWIVTSTPSDGTLARRIVHELLVGPLSDAEDLDATVPVVEPDPEGDPRTISNGLVATVLPATAHEARFGTAMHGFVHLIRHPTPHDDTEAWARHTTSWNALRAEVPHVVVRVEDLLSDAVHELRRIAVFFETAATAPTLAGIAGRTLTETVAPADPFDPTEVSDPVRTALEGVGYGPTAEDWITPAVRMRGIVPLSTEAAGALKARLAHLGDAPILV